MPKHDTICANENCGKRIPAARKERSYRPVLYCSVRCGWAVAYRKRYAFDSAKEIGRVRAAQKRRKKSEKKKKG
jgi:hypothetical protein